MNLNELVAAVEESGDDDPLARVAAAAAVKEEIEALGDELLDHFVKDAREAGCSWTQIGDALGVTRQAAQQRDGGLLGRLVAGLKESKFRRFTLRARAAVIAAQSAARDRRHASIDTEHLLLGLFDAHRPGQRRGAGPGSLRRRWCRRRRPRGRARAERHRVRTRSHPVHASRQEGARAHSSRSVAAGPQLHRLRAHPPRLTPGEAGSGGSDPRRAGDRVRGQLDAAVREILTTGAA